MTTKWATVPLWSVAREQREVVEPAQLGEKVVHYSIPSVDATGTGQVEDAGEIKSAKLRLRGGEVLISKLNPRISRVVQVNHSDLPLVASTEFVALHPQQSLDSRFLAYLLQSETVRQQLDARVQSVTRSHQRVAPEDITHLMISLPESGEQRRIADFLDAETARIDRLISVRTQQRSSLEERSYAYVSETLIPGITRAARGSWPWFWLPELDDDRPLVRLGYVCRLQTGITIDGSRNAGSDWVTRPYLRVANVQAGYLDLSSVTEVTVPEAMALRSTLRPGDVLMTEGGDLDKLGRGTVWSGEIPNCLHQNHVFALRPDPDRLDADYLALMTQTVHGRCYFESTGSKTTNLASTNSSKIMSFPIPLPALSRQRDLVREVHKRLDVLARAKTKLDCQLELLAERRQALITAAVTGQIDVSTASGRTAEG